MLTNICKLHEINFALKHKTEVYLKNPDSHYLIAPYYNLWYLVSREGIWIGFTKKYQDWYPHRLNGFAEIYATSTKFSIECSPSSKEKLEMHLKKEIEKLKHD